MQSVILHIMNEDPVLGEVDALPAGGDYVVLVRNPRRRDGKDLNYIEPNVSAVIWPMSRINFIEVLPGAEDEEIITFVRE